MGFNSGFKGLTVNRSIPLLHLAGQQAHWNPTGFSWLKFQSAARRCHRRNHVPKKTAFDNNHIGKSWHYNFVRKLLKKGT